MRKIVSEFTYLRRQNASRLTILRIHNEQSLWEKADTILCYLSFNSELDMDPLIHSALEMGKNVFVPRIESEDIEFYQITSILQPRNKEHGLREPVIGETRWHGPAEDELCLILVPGMAFDLSGRRLGRGKGMYDRFISRVRKTSKEPSMKLPLFIGVCYDEQIVKKVPEEKHDARIDAILCESELSILPGAENLFASLP